MPKTKKKPVKRKKAKALFAYAVVTYDNKINFPVFYNKESAQSLLGSGEKFIKVKITEV